MKSERWKVRLTRPAEADLRQILRFTGQAFGPAQVTVYRATLLATLAELADGPDVVGSASRDIILPGLRTVHVARHGRRGRHFIVYRCEEPRCIEVLRILHDAMDLQRHLSPDTD